MCEFITGGGLCGAPLADSLAKEGALMRDALLLDLSEARNLADLPYEIVTTIDARLQNDALRASIHAACRPVNKDDDVWAIWKSMIAEADAVLVIAPETDGVLLKFAQLSHDLGKVWLGCSLKAIEIASNKLKTYAFLHANNISVPALTWQSFCDYETKYPNVLFAKNNQYVAKPIDGAGCIDTFVFNDIESLNHFMAPTVINNRQKTHIIQLFIKGQPASLVMLCANGQAHLLCCNKQMMLKKNKQLQFNGVEINGLQQHWSVFERITQDLAKWLPGLNGLVGIDLVLYDKMLSVIEINPRLTTSYVGLHRATGVNPAQLLLESTSNANFVMPKISRNMVLIHV